MHQGILQVNGFVYVVELGRKEIRADFSRVWQVSRSCGGLAYALQDVPVMASQL